MAGRNRKPAWPSSTTTSALVLQKLKDMGEDDNTIVVFTTDNGTELFTWPDGGTTPFAQCKGTVMEGGFRVPCILRWPGKVPADTVQNGLMSGLDWFPTFLAAAGNTDHHRRPAQGRENRRPDLQEPSGRLQPDGPDHRQRPVRRVTKSSTSAKARSARCASTTTSSASSTSPRAGWVKRPILDVPYITNLRLDPFERMGWPNNGTKEGAQQYFDWFKFQFWRFVFVQQVMGKELQTFLEYPPMQRGARPGPLWTTLLWLSAICMGAAGSLSAFRTDHAVSAATPGRLYPGGSERMSSGRATTRPAPFARNSSSPRKPQRTPSGNMPALTASSMSMPESPT